MTANYNENNFKKLLETRIHIFFFFFPKLTSVHDKKKKLACDVTSHSTESIFGNVDVVRSD